MTQFSSQTLTQLTEHTLPGLPLPDDFLPPYYEGLSLVNIPATIAQLLATPSFGKSALDKRITRRMDGPFTKVILLVVDALGYQLLNQLMETCPELFWNRMSDKAVFSPLTSVCPSTTASALTTLWTGEGPAAHGIIGYEMWAKEYGMVMNNILHSAASARTDTGGLARSGFDPHEFLNKPLLGTHLHKHGVKTTAFINSSIAHSGLSVMQMEDVNVKPYVDEADLWVNLAQHVNSRQGDREYLYAYYSDVDTLMHRYNAADQRVTLQFKAFTSMMEEAFIGELSEAAAQETLLIMVADHGSMSTPLNHYYDLGNHPELINCLVMQPTCENRLAFLFIKPGKEERVRAYIDETWQNEFVFIDPDRALEAGLFGKGPYKANTRERLGDLIVAARGEAYFWWAPKPNHMLGRHGGLNPEEMLVPFYALPLKAL